MGVSRAEGRAMRGRVKEYLASHGPATSADIVKRAKVSTALIIRMRKEGLLEMEIRGNGRGSGKVGSTFLYSLAQTNGNLTPKETKVVRSFRTQLNQTARIAEASEILFGKGGPTDYSVYLHWVELTKEMM